MSNATKEMLLREAVLNEDLRRVDSLRRSGAKGLLYIYPGVSALHYALLKKESDLLWALYPRGAPPMSALNEYGVHALHICAFGANVKHFAWVLNRYKPNIYLKDLAQNSIWDYALAGMKPKECTMVLGKKARIYELLDWEEFYSGSVQERSKIFEIKYFEEQSVQMNLIRKALHLEESTMINVLHKYVDKERWNSVLKWLSEHRHLSIGSIWESLKEQYILEKELANLCLVGGYGTVSSALICERWAQLVSKRLALKAKVKEIVSGEILIQGKSNSYKEQLLLRVEPDFNFGGFNHQCDGENINSAIDRGGGGVDLNNLQWCWQYLFDVEGIVDDSDKEGKSGGSGRGGFFSGVPPPSLLLPDEHFVKPIERGKPKEAQKDKSESSKSKRKGWL